MKNWVSFNWSSGAGLDKAKTYEIHLTNIERNTSVRWSNGRAPTDIPMNRNIAGIVGITTSTHILFKRDSGELGYTENAAFLKNAYEVYDFYDFIEEIKNGLLVKTIVLQIKDKIAKSLGIDNVSKYDTVCYHCGAPARTLFFNVECSKGCQC